MSRQCPSCGCFCKPSGCERVNDVLKDAVNAEPVGWIDSRSLDTISDFDATVYANGGFDFAQPLYTHPAPSVVQQLVEALSRMTSVFLDTEGSYGSYETDAIEFAEQALTAAKEAGL